MTGTDSSVVLGEVEDLWSELFFFFSSSCFPKFLVFRHQPLVIKLMDLQWRILWPGCVLLSVGSGSWLSTRNFAVDQVLRAGFWALQTTFTSFYPRDVSH